MLLGASLLHATGKLLLNQGIACNWRIASYKIKERNYADQPKILSTGLRRQINDLGSLMEKIKYLVVLTMSNRKYNDKFYLSKFTCEPAFLACT